MNKMLKNITALTVLGTASLMSMNVYAENNVSDKIQLYMDRLNVMDIMSETDDMSKVLTRGEMAKIICGIGGYTVTHSDEKIFADVPRDYIYSDYINTAYTYGIINGTGNGMFSPDEEVTREQMYKMLLCTAGYEAFAQKDGGYPTGYISQASKNGIIMSGASGTVTVSEAAYTVFKALEMPVVRTDYDDSVIKGDGDDTLLNQWLDKNDMAFYDGVLTFDGYTDLLGFEVPNDYMAKIDGEKVDNNGTQLKGMVGKHIEYFTKDDAIVAAYEYPGKNSSVRFDTEDISSVNGLSSYIVSDKDNKRTTYRLSDSPYMVYNMQGMSDYSDEYLKPENGNVTLIDNDDDNKYDVILVNNIKYYVVDDVSSSGLSVKYKKYSGQNDSGYYVSENDLENSIFYNVTDGDGNYAEPSIISKNSVVGVSKSLDGTMINVIVTKKTADGSVTSLSDDEITIGQIKYETAVSGSSTAFDIKVGDVVRGYLNENGKLVYCETQSSSGADYAYIKNVFYEEGPDKMYITVVESGNLGSVENVKYSWVKDKMAQNSGIKTYELKDKVRINGAKTTKDKLYELLYNIVNLEINSEGVVTNIEVLTPEFEYTKGKFNHNTSALLQESLAVDYDNPATVLTGNVKTLVIPKSTSKKYTEEEYMAKYRIENDSSNHQVAVYDIPENSQTPRLIVLKAVLSKSGTAQEASATGILTTNIRTGIDEDGDDYYFVEMYDTNGNIREVSIRDDATRSDASVKPSIEDLRKGDIVEFGWDSNGKALTVNIIASAATPLERMQMGKVAKVQKNVIWNKSNGDDYYNLFYYYNSAGNRIEAGVEADYPIFRFKDGNVEKIEPADIVTDPDGINADTVIIAGKIAVILPIE